MVGNDRYLALGGEFPKVNGAPQQGLVRMAMPALAPNAVGPTGGDRALALDAAAHADRSVAVSWGQLWDRDDLDLTYRLTRDGTVVHTRRMAVPFWNRTRMTFVDTGAADCGSSTVEYQVMVYDPSGNSVKSTTIKVTLPTAPSTTSPG